MHLAARPMLSDTALSRHYRAGLVLAEFGVNDEFPTLEVALAVCVLWLGFRGFALARGAALLNDDVAVLLSAVRRRAAPRSAARGGRDSAWLEDLGRAALSIDDGSGSAEQAHASLRERAARIRRRLRSAAARDLVVCAVLVGAMTYARTTSLGVSVWFFALGALAGLLLLTAVGLRLWHDAQVNPVTERLSVALTERGADAPTPAAREVCPKCGAGELESVSGRRNLGKKLTALGVSEVLLCSRCGHVGGHVVRR